MITLREATPTARKAHKCGWWALDHQSDAQHAEAACAYLVRRGAS